jgi:LysR family transcriptional regulator, glycine cleavage system transcriptional activator
MTMRLPPLNALRAFEAAARHESFARAAAELHLTPSAISHQIRNLEELLGAELFLREARGLRLNDTGRRYQVVVRDAFARLVDGTAGIFGDPRRNCLTVSVMPAIAAYFLIPRLARFRAAHPELDVELDTTERFAMIGPDGVDVGIRYGPGPQTDLHGDLLFVDRMTPVCSPGLLQGRPLLNPVDIASFTLLHDRRAEGEWRQWLAAAGVAQDGIGQRLRFDTTAAAYHAAEAGLGFAMGWLGLLQGRLAEGQLIAPFPHIVLSRAQGYYLVSAAGQENSPRIAAFRHWLKDEVSRLPSDPGQGSVI